MMARTGFVLISLMILGSGIFAQTPRVYTGTESVATVSFPIEPRAPDGPHTIVYVVNYSDLFTFLAMRPDPYSGKPSSAELYSALEEAINERLLHHAADGFLHMRRIRFSKADIEAWSAELAKTFDSTEEFERRVKLVNEQPRARSIRYTVFALDRMEIETYLRLQNEPRGAVLKRLRETATIQASKKL